VARAAVPACRLRSEGGNDMTGSGLAPIVIPIVAMISLFGWLAVVFTPTAILRMAVIAALRRRSGRRLRLASQGLHPPMTSWVPDPVRLIVAVHSHTTEPVTVPCRPRSRPASALNPAAGAATAGALTTQGSQTGSQRRQTSGHIRQPPAMVLQPAGLPGHAWQHAATPRMRLKRRRPAVRPAPDHQF